MNTNFLQNTVLNFVNSFTNQERTNPVKQIITFAAVLALSVVATSSMAQTYKPDWATKLVLAGNGTDVTNNFTINAPTLGSAISWTLPNSNGTNGYMLTTNGAGVLSWTNPATGVTLAGDVTGAAGSNTVVK